MSDATAEKEELTTEGTEVHGSGEKVSTDDLVRAAVKAYSAHMAHGSDGSVMGIRGVVLAVRELVEAPLLARVAELDKELGEACAAARKKQGISDCSICGRETKNTGPCMVCLSEQHRAELEAVKAERDNYKSMLEEEVAAGSEYLERAEAMGCPKDGNINDAYAWALAELAALRQRDAVPVDPDAWKTDLVVAWLKFREAGRQIILVDNTQAMGALGSLSAIDAARAAQWLASYAAAHGCPAQHAVIDVPAGVPSVDELADDGDQQPENNCPVCDGTGHVADTEDGPVIADCPVCDQTLPFYSFINGFPVCPQCGFSDAPVPTPAPTDEQVEAPEKRDAVPVKVRFDCAGEEMAEALYTAWANEQLYAIPWTEMSETNKNLVRCYAENSKKYLARYAVIDAPAPAPTDAQVEAAKAEMLSVDPDFRAKISEVVSNPAFGAFCESIGASREEIITGAMRVGEALCDPAEYGAWHFEDGKFVPNARTASNGEDSYLWGQINLCGILDQVLRDGISTEFEQEDIRRVAGYVAELREFRNRPTIQQDPAVALLAWIRAEVVHERPSPVELTKAAKSTRYAALWKALYHA